MYKRKNEIGRRLSMAAFATCLVSGANATEGGASAYPNGIENFMTAAMPPPGIYGASAFDIYSANKLMGNDGRKLDIPGFQINVNAVANGVIWVTNTKVIGGDLIWKVIIPVVNVSASAAGMSQTKTGIGDIAAGLGIGFHHSPFLHSLLALEVGLPTGSYHKNDFVNIGQNHLAVLPFAGVTYVDPKGFNGDIKLGLILNRRNDATGVKSGNEIHFDYALGWGVSPSWTVGIGGYIYQQFGDDSGPGANGQRASARAVGPSAKFESGRGWFATLKFEKEFSVKNRPRGDSIWLKAYFAL